MNKEEFKQKMTDIKQKMQGILSEVKLCDAYIYNQRNFCAFYNQVQKHINDITYNIDYYGPKNTTEAFRNEMFNEFNGYLELDINMWNDLKKIRFVAPRCSKEKLARLSGQMLDIVSRVSNNNLLNIKSSLEEIYHISSDPSAVLSTTQIAEMKRNLNSYAKTIKTNKNIESENNVEPVEREQ